MMTTRKWANGGARSNNNFKRAEKKKDSIFIPLSRYLGVSLGGDRFAADFMGTCT